MSLKRSHRVELGIDTHGYALLMELLERRQPDTEAAKSIVISYKQMWNWSYRIGRTAQFAASVFTHKKDDRVESIYAEPRCDSASTRGKHSI